MKSESFILDLVSQGEQSKKPVSATKQEHNESMVVSLDTYI